MSIYMKLFVVGLVGVIMVLSGGAQAQQACVYSVTPVHNIRLNAACANACVQNRGTCQTELQCARDCRIQGANLHCENQSDANACHGVQAQQACGKVITCAWLAGNMLLTDVQKEEAERITKILDKEVKKSEILQE